MAEQTAIGWTDATFNGWIGCEEVGPGCVPCYARELDRKYQYGVPGAERAPGIAPVAPNWTNDRRHRTSAGYWNKVHQWNARAAAAGKPLKVFAHSLSDVFDNVVPEVWRHDEYRLWRETPWLRWIVVTKRVSNIKKMLPKDWGTGYPNVGFVCTTVNQDEFDRDADRLFSIPARWHGFSMEPQLARIVTDPVHLPRSSVWFITGGESAQGSVKHPMIDKDTGMVRVPVPYDPEWADVLVKLAADCPHLFIYVKQLGACPVGMPAPRDGMGKDPEQWPESIRVHQFPPELLS